MSESVRIAFVHTGAVVIAPVMALAGELMPGTTTVNYLDDKIVADLGDPDRVGSVPDRLHDLVAAARRGGAHVVMLTCSSISEHAGSLTEDLGIPVYRIDEAMADVAAATGPRIAVIATLPTTCEPTTRLIRERAELIGANPDIRSEVVEGAFAAVSTGDRETHDRLVVAAIERAAKDADVVVLAQASMASAADAANVAIPVLSSLRPGIERLAGLIAGVSQRAR